MKIIVFLTVFALPVDNFLLAQQAVLNSGGNALSSSGSVSFSLGQLVVQTAEGISGSVSAGVQQAFEFQTLSLDEFPGLKLQLKLYPNPVKEFIFISFPGNERTGFEVYELYDLSGRRIRSGTISGNETQVSFQDLPATVYLLNIIREKNVLKTFKVIKNGYVLE